MNDLYNDIVLGSYKLVDEHLQNKNMKCYLALMAALKRDVNAAKQYLMSTQETELSNTDRLICLETQVVLSYFCGNFAEMEKYAEQALALSDKAFFARSLLARVLTWKKKFDIALEHYKILLEMYPLDSSTLLDLAFCVLVANKDYQESIKYVLKAKRSFRRTMYLLLIPLKITSVRLLLAILTLLLFSLTPIGTFLFGLISLLILLGCIITILKLGLDPLIITRLISLQVIITGMWLITWIAEKYW